MKRGLEEKLKDKVVLITGASKGVGMAIAERLSSYAMKIGLLARSTQQLNYLQKQINAAGSEAMVLCADLRNQADIERAVFMFIEKFGTPDFLINNAGIGTRGFWEDISLERELEITDVNYKAPLILMRLLLPKMLIAGRGHIININTIGGMYPAPYQGAYCASKAALLTYVTSLAYELEHRNIYMTSIFPGPIDTNFLDNANFEGFKKSKEIISPYELADKVLLVINQPKERVFMGSFLKLFAVKIASLHPRFFRRVIEAKNSPPQRL